MQDHGPIGSTLWERGLTRRRLWWRLGVGERTVSALAYVADKVRDPTTHVSARSSRPEVKIPDGSGWGTTNREKYFANDSFARCPLREFANERMDSSMR